MPVSNRCMKGINMDSFTDQWKEATSGVGHSSRLTAAQQFKVEILLVRAEQTRVDPTSSTCCVTLVKSLPSWCNKGPEILARVLASGKQSIPLPVGNINCICFQAQKGPHNIYFEVGNIDFFSPSPHRSQKLNNRFGWNIQQNIPLWARTQVSPQQGASESYM